MTDKERRFWEKCGFTFEPIPFKSGGGFYEHEKYIIYPNGEKYRITKGDYPDVNSLDSLMKYAVPKLRDLSEDNTLKDIEFHWEGLNISDVVEVNVVLDFQEFTGRNKSPAKALYEALCQALEVEG